MISWGIDHVSGVFMRDHLSVETRQTLEITSHNSPHGRFSGKHGWVVGAEEELSIFDFLADVGVIGVGADGAGAGAFSTGLRAYGDE